MIEWVRKHIEDVIPASPLTTFRVGFGLLMCLAMLRFWYYDWINHLYIEPSFFFSYPGFSWVKPLGQWTHLLFAVCLWSSIALTLGWKYRLHAILLFLSFTYIELMDMTNYLNHYYLVSLISFLLCWLPGQLGNSMDNKADKYPFYMEGWPLLVLQLLFAIVYIYAGLAKLNSDWLLRAMPLKMWLVPKMEMPFIGSLLRQEWVAYTFSWLGALYDLFIVFLLMFRPTRNFAFFSVIIFHLLTYLLFPIGIFPFLMILGATLFYPPETHQFYWNKVRSRLNKPILKRKKVWRLSPNKRLPYTLFFVLFFVSQLLLPIRFLAYEGPLFWTESGFRFSWRVMLIEKAGYAQFQVVDQDTQTKITVNNAEYLSPQQEKQMSTQPDFILQYARYLARIYRRQGMESPQVYVESYVALNGRSSQPYVRKDVNLLEYSFWSTRSQYLYPFGDSIHGLQ